MPVMLLSAHSPFHGSCSRKVSSALFQAGNHGGTGAWSAGPAVTSLIEPCKKCPLSWFPLERLGRNGSPASPRGVHSHGLLALEMQTAPRSGIRALPGDKESLSRGPHSAKSTRDSQGPPAGRPWARLSLYHTTWHTAAPQPVLDKLNSTQRAPGSQSFQPRH